MRPRLALLLPFALAACVTTPVVSDYNGSSVKIQTDSLMAPKRSAATDGEATRICNAGGKRRAEYASSRELQGYTAEHLYLCLN